MKKSTFRKTMENLTWFLADATAVLIVPASIWI